MVYFRRSATTARLSGTHGFRRRRRKALRPDMAKIRYQAPTSRNQKSQIMRNARVINRHCNLLRNHRVWTDWQCMNEAIFQSDTWNCFRLTDFSQWNPVLRQNMAVSRMESSTYVDRLVLNLRVSLFAAHSSVVSFFIVTPRKTFATRDVVTTPPALTTEFIYPQNNPGYNVRLNSNVWKVHACKYMTLTTNGLDNPPAAPIPEMAGNPFTTYRKWQVTVPCKMKVTIPYIPAGSAETWQDTQFDMLPFYNRYFLMVYNHTIQASPTSDAPFLTFDQLATCINSD